MKHLWKLQGVYKTHVVAVGMFCTPVARRLLSRLYADPRSYAWGGVAAVGSFAVLVPDQSLGVLVYDLAEPLSELNPRSVAVPSQTRSVANPVHRGELGVGATSTGSWSYKGAAVFGRDVYAAPYDGSFVLRFHQPNETIEMIQVPLQIAQATGREYIQPPQPTPFGRD